MAPDTGLRGTGLLSSWLQAVFANPQLAIEHIELPTIGEFLPGYETGLLC